MTRPGSAPGSLRTIVFLTASASVILGSLPESAGKDAASERPAVPLSSYQDLRWRNVGPHRGGRVTAIAGVRQRPCTFYMGATGGGVWKTESCGNLWTPISDGQIATGSIGAIDVAESDPNVVYVGTGSAAIRNNVIIGRGVYKSADAGRTWTFLGLPSGGQIGDLKIHPQNADIAWLAALGSPFGSNDERGIYKTVDGGKTWRRTLFVNAETGARAVAVNKANPSEVYAAMHRAARKGWDIISGGPASEGGIYKSDDGGETWRKLAGGLPTRLVGKIDIDIARSNPRIVYAMVEAPHEEGGLYRSDDAGATWRLVNNDAGPRDRPFYFHYVDVNPSNAEEVWISAEDLWKSTDGGRSFEVVAVPHGDVHGLWFNPDDPRIILQGNDGGATVSLDSGTTWSSILNQPTAELYMVSVDEQHPYRLYGPQQDNSTIAVPSLPPVSWSYDSPAMSWMQASGCETGQIVPRPDGKVIYGVCKGEFGRYSVETGQEKHYWVYPQYRYGHHPDDITYRFPRQGVIVVSPHDPRVIYHASHVVHRTDNEGETWETVSGDLTAREPEYQLVPGNPITRDISGEEVYSAIYAFAESRLEKGVLWAGANDGPVHVSRDGGKTWRNVTPEGLPPGGRVQTIEDSPHRRGSAYIAVYRFLREHDLKPYIYRTDDYGQRWTLLTDGRNGIPGDEPARAVREDPSRDGLLYAGTELGAYVSFDNGRRWQSLQQNLPATPITDIRVHRDDLVIATMGRSFWIMDDISPLRQLRTDSSATTPVLLQPREAVRYRHGTMGAGPDVPDYPPPGAWIDYILPEGFTGSATIDILNAAGSVVRTFRPDTVVASLRQDMRGPRRGAAAPSATAPRPGHNRIAWNYRWTGSGPMAAPGAFTVRLTVGTQTVTQPLRVLVDPRVSADGVTQADLEEQERFLLEVEKSIEHARDLQRRVEAAMKLGKVAPVPPLSAGERPFGAAGRAEPGRYAHDLQVAWARLVNNPSPYPQRMLIDQLTYLRGMLNRADQRVGQDAYVRYRHLADQLAEITREVNRLTQARSDAAK